MRSTYSSKTLQTAPTTNLRTRTFYKDIKFKKVQSQFRIKNQKKQITIAKNPWSSAINKKDVDDLVIRLNDTPDTLYRVIKGINDRAKMQGKRWTGGVGGNKENWVGSRQVGAKFTVIKPFLKSRYSESKGNIENNAKSVPVTSRELPVKQAQLLRKIEKAKKKYVQQYRKMLLGMKAIDLETDLPRIKYVEQNDLCTKINLLHGGNRI